MSDTEFVKLIESEVLRLCLACGINATVIGYEGIQSKEDALFYLRMFYGKTLTFGSRPRFKNDPPPSLAESSCKLRAQVGSLGCEKSTAAKDMAAKLNVPIIKV